MDVDVCAGLLAVATDARPGRRCPSCLASPLSKRKTKGSDSRAGSASGFRIFGAVGYTSLCFQNHRKRKRALKRLPPSPKSALSGDQKGSNWPKTGYRKPITAVLVTASVFKVQYFFERSSCAQLDNSKLRSGIRNSFLRRSNAEHGSWTRSTG